MFFSHPVTYPVTNPVTNVLGDQPAPHCKEQGVPGSYADPQTTAGTSELLFNIGDCVLKE